METSNTVAGYIASAPLQARTMMKEIRSAIRSAAPEAAESISYGMPFYAYKYPGYKGRLTYFGAFTKHVSLFIIPRKVPASLAAQVRKYKAEKATLQFPLGTRVPTGLIKKLVKLRMKEIDAAA
jgi:uncharacterized protein YdhG (YjbR/CyaY superfamily)